VVLSVLIGIFLAFNRRQMVLLALDREMAYLSGINTDLFQLGMNLVLAISVILGIKVLGVILVSALLIIPVSIAKLISRSFQKLVFLSIILAEVIVLLGLVISYVFDFPTGAVIVLTGSTLFFFVFLARGFTKG